jgi:hypothetical protein
MTFIIGKVITDCWRGYNHHLHDNHRHKGMELLEYTKILAKDMIDNKYPNTPTSKAAYSNIDKIPPTIIVDSPTPASSINNHEINFNNSANWEIATKISTLTSNSPSDIGSTHTLCCNYEFTSHVKIEGQEKDWKEKKKR